jgi:NADH-ubiquinone oxidoreductase chain 2
VGGVGGLRQTRIRPLLAYSSINHIGWIVSVRTCSCTIAIIYLTIYIFTTTLIVLTINYFNRSSLETGVFLLDAPQFYKLWFSALIMSLAGVPPFIGFFPKWATFVALTEAGLWAPAIALLIGSLIALFYYLNITFSHIFIPSLSSTKHPPSISIIFFLTAVLAASLLITPYLLL